MAPALDRDRRHRLVRSMLDLVLAALRGAVLLERKYVLTPDLALVPHDFEHIRDTGLGLNEELRRAAALASARGADAILVLPGDLPWITARSIDTLLAKASPRTIIVAPDRAERGTNALLLAPPSALSPQFGPNSLALHVGSAASTGIAPRLHWCPNFARDVDEPRDLAQLLAHPTGQFQFLSARAVAEAG